MRTRFFLFVMTLLVVSSLAANARAQIDARMFRFPDVSETHIAFVYAGDIWIVDKTGGTAKRLSSPPGEERFPRFSPDGSRIAFSGNYDGNTDVYVVPSMGGEPVRVTHHPGADRLIDWTPDGSQLLFASRRGSGVRRFNQLYLVAPTGGLPEKLPVAYGEFGALSMDARRLAYTPKSRGFRTWKRYRGGMAPEIWLFDLETYEARNLTESDANDAQPMWHGNTIYFLSDRGDEQRSNIWAVDVESNEKRQVTRFADFDVTWPAVGSQEIVFQAGGRLYLMSLATEQYAEVEVDVVTDLASLRPRIENVSDLIQAANISPTGKRALFQARGEIFTVPAEHGATRNLTRSSGVAERYPAWSPDGKHIAYWSDRTGEYELTLRPSDGTGEERTLTHYGAGYRYRLFWSPDSKKIAFIDNAQKLQIYDMEADRITQVDQDLWRLHGGLQGFEASWSGDSRWLTYARGLETGNNAIYVFDTRDGESHQVTSGYYSDAGPVFDPDGEYLYYLTNRTLEPTYSDLDATWIYSNTTIVAAAPLRKDVKSPIAPRNDDEEIDEEEAEDKGEEGEEGGEAADEDATSEANATEVESQVASDDTESKPEEEEQEKEEPAEVLIDLEGFEQRVVLLPPEEGNYAKLRAVSGKVIYHRLPRTGSSSEERPIVYYDLEEREEETVRENASDFEISANGEKMLVEADEAFVIIDIKPGSNDGSPGKGKKERLASGDLQTLVDPKLEWKQLFTDVWRTYRDYFYDPDMHGLDWAALRTHYGALLEAAVTRWDVNFVIGELIGEVNASHTYVGGGDTETPHRRQVGLLGIDWALEGGAYRIASIVHGAAWDIEARSPLSEPGVDVGEGDYILAVNGILLDTSRDPYAAFEGLAEKTVALTVNDQPTLEGAREVIVKTLASESRLRNLAWVEANRQKVVEATDDRVGYIFVPNTSISGQTELVRQLNSQMRKQGLIIDERFNSGGQLPDRFIEKLNRQMVTRIAFRNGGVHTHPRVTHYGPKVMLINGWAGSGGDAFPYFFKQMEVGPLVGERTWGGLIGPAVGHQLIDGGRFTAPPGRLYGPDGVWFAEGHGVDPDIPVVDDPGLMAKGGDPQLQAAIAEVLRLIELNPPTFAEPPRFENRVRGEGEATVKRR